MHGRILSLKQDDKYLHYKSTWPKSIETASSSVPETAAAQSDDTETLLRQYFCLDIDLKRLYEQWSSVDPVFRRKAPLFTGVRILNQDAWEALLAFICSSNNNISRISQMVGHSLPMMSS